MSIASEIARIQGAKSSIRTAIENKGVSIPSMTKIDGYASYVSEIGTGNVSNDVNFYDYDGTLLYSYSKEDFLELTSMPSNPSHSGLTAQGWNWSLSDAKEYVTAYGILDIGQMYITDDGKTRLYITIEDNDYKSPTLYWWQQASNSVYVNWGDGTEEIVSGSGNKNKQHTYATVGDYIITLNGDSNYQLGNSTVSTPALSSDDSDKVHYWAILKKVELGANITLRANSFYNATNLRTISIPTGNIFGSNTSIFNNCYSLVSITVPYGVTYLHNNIFYRCFSLGSACVPKSVATIGVEAFYICNIKRFCTPPSITTINRSCFNLCESMTSIVIPSGVTKIDTTAFYFCTSLDNVQLPQSLTTMSGNCFGFCCSLKEIEIPSGVTTLASACFTNCYSLTAITLPNMQDLESQQLYNCYALRHVSLPSQLVNIKDSSLRACSLEELNIPSSVTTIGNYAIYGNKLLTKVIISSEVTTIGNYGFGDNPNVKEYHFLSTTPPSAGTNIFSGIANDAVIYVPSASLETYKTANNLTQYASKMVGE